MKFKGSGWNRTPVIERNRFSLFKPLWPWPLTYWPPKSIGIFYSLRAITLRSLKALGQWVLKLLSGNGFHSSGPCDLELWPTNPKINRVLPLNKVYQPMKIEGSGSKGTQVIERKRFSLFGPLWPWPWPTDPKINRVLLLTKGYHPMKFEGSGSKGTTARVRTTIVNGRTDGRTDAGRSPLTKAHPVTMWQVS